MTYTEIANILDADIVQTALVTRPKGSWKWQDAFAIAYYRWSVNHDETGGVWRYIGRDSKMSKPQMRAANIDWDHEGRPYRTPQNKETA